MGAPRKQKTHQVRCFGPEWEAIQAEIRMSAVLETQAGVIARWHGVAAAVDAATDGRNGRNISHEMRPRGAVRGDEPTPQALFLDLPDIHSVVLDFNPKGGDFNEGSRHEERGKEAEEGREEGQEEVAAAAAGVALQPPRVPGDVLDMAVTLKVHEPREFETLPYHDDDYMVLYRYAPLRPIFITVAHLKATPPRHEWLGAVGPVPRFAP